MDIFLGVMPITFCKQWISGQIYEHLVETNKQCSLLWQPITSNSTNATPNPLHLKLLNQYSTVAHQIKSWTSESPNAVGNRDRRAKSVTRPIWHRRRQPRMLAPGSPRPGLTRRRTLGTAPSASPSIHCQFLHQCPRHVRKKLAVDSWAGEQ